MRFMVRDFITPSMSWDVVKLRDFVCLEDVEAIIRIPISGLDRRDGWTWNYSKKGEMECTLSRAGIN